MYMDGKSCTICNIHKSFSDFYKNSSMKDGFHPYCKRCLKEYSKKWGKEHRDKLYKYQRKYHRKMYHIKYKYDPRFKLENSIRRSIWKSLRGGKSGRHWETLVGYTIDDLMKWLELKFSNEMTWDNYGKTWHIDHIVPQSWFHYSSPNENSFKECWKLTNLQPLLVEDNLFKGNRFSS